MVRLATGLHLLLLVLSHHKSICDLLHRIRQRLLLLLARGGCPLLCLLLLQLLLILTQEQTSLQLALAIRRALRWLGVLVKADAEVRDHHRLVVFALIAATLACMSGLHDSGLLARRAVNLLSRVSVCLLLAQIRALFHLLSATIIALARSD